jgi:Flp pilus assembly protein TadD
MPRKPPDEGPSHDRAGKPRRPRPSGRPRPDEPRELPAGGRGWGGLARKGTKNLGERKWEGADHADRPEPSPPDAWEADRWVQEPRAKEEAVPPSRRRPPRPVPAPVADELAKAVGAERAARLASKLADGVRAFERDHFDEARQLLQPVADEAPTAASVRELLGLTYYRLGRWRQAVRELEAFAELSRSTSSAAVLADANRALGRHSRVKELWEEIRVASEDPATVTEGRIVAAGSLADQGRLADAIALLEKGRLSAKHPEDHHLRLWYALADLYERAGEVPRARDLFERVARHDPGLVDVVARRRALG